MSITFISNGMAYNESNHLRLYEYVEHVDYSYLQLYAGTLVAEFADALQLRVRVKKSRFESHS